LFTLTCKINLYDYNILVPHYKLYNNLLKKKINTRALCKSCKVINVQENKEEAIILSNYKIK
jgi:hypothetical protein